MRFVLVCLIGFASSVWADDKKEISDLLDGFHLAAADADYEGYFAKYADDAVFLGTDASERWTLAEFRDYARRPFEQGTGWRYVSVKRHIEQSPANHDVAWFDEILENPRLGHCRGTGVVIRDKNGWRVAHYSLSMLIPNEIATNIARQVMIAEIEARKRKEKAKKNAAGKHGD